MKKFQRTIEDFICEHCGEKIKGDGYTNHCPHCLWSKHVDINPGDRVSNCQGLMKPIALENKNSKQIIIHRCLKCKHKKRNKIAKNDSFATLIKLSKQNNKLY